EVLFYSIGAFNELQECSLLHFPVKGLSKSIRDKVYTCQGILLLLHYKQIDVLFSFAYIVLRL
ncbi:MAG: hypothetical protein ACLTMH_12350, partial [Faecalimonas umbilicata]|uniref:hypothetical protein n=1 Tax=Faecalimonas umbilicata TaxID=1912855 RepID=UPI003992D758